MPVVDVAIGVLAGGLLGGVSGFAIALGVLVARRRENDRLVARGELPRKNMLLPRFHVPGAVLGAAVGGIAVPLTSTPVGLGLAFLAPVAVYAVLLLVAWIGIRRDASRRS